MTDKGCYGHMRIDREQLRQVLGMERPRIEMPEAETEAWIEYWRREALRKYPNPDAYEAVCRARDSWQARAEREIKRRDELGKLLQKAEKERDRLKSIVDAKYLSLNKGDEEARWAMQEENIALREANTAMREELELLRESAWMHGGTKAVERLDILLSRYPKEGE